MRKLKHAGKNDTWSWITDIKPNFKVEMSHKIGIQGNWDLEIPGSMKGGYVAVHTTAVQISCLLCPLLTWCQLPVANSKLTV